VQSATATRRRIGRRRADRPEVVRPDLELGRFLKFDGPVKNQGESYIISGTVRTGGTAKTDAEDAPPPINVTFTLNLSGGVVRDYEVEIEGSRVTSHTRMQVPFHDHRIVIITYLPVTRINIPDEARDKLAVAKLPAKR